MRRPSSWWLELATHTSIMSIPSDIVADLPHGYSFVVCRAQLGVSPCRSIRTPLRWTFRELLKATQTKQQHFPGPRGTPSVHPHPPEEKESKGMLGRPHTSPTDEMGSRRDTSQASEGSARVLGPFSLAGALLSGGRPTPGRLLAPRTLGALRRHGAVRRLAHRPGSREPLFTSRSSSLCRKRLLLTASPDVLEPKCLLNSKCNSY